MEDQQIFDVIARGGQAIGKSEAMPANPQLSESEVWNLVAYVRSLKTSDSPDSRDQDAAGSDSGAGPWYPFSTRPARIQASKDDWNGFGNAPGTGFDSTKMPSSQSFKLQLRPDGAHPTTQGTDHTTA